MQETAKYLPKTANALKKLQDNLALLENSADISAQKQQELTEKLTTLRKQLADKAECIDNIINTLNGALK